MKKLIVFFGGLFIVYFGVALLLELNIGSDPFTVFTQGIAHVVGITPGGANRIITCILLVILGIFSRKSIQIGCFLSLLFAGVFIDLSLWFIAPLHLGELYFVGRLVLFMVACIIIGIGFPLLKCANLGVSPNDLVYLILSDKLNKPYRIVRMGVDFILAIVGFLLGGVIGLGTVLCVIFIGPTIQFFFDKVERVANKFLGEVEIT